MHLLENHIRLALMDSFSPFRVHSLVISFPVCLKCLFSFIFNWLVMCWSQVYNKIKPSLNIFPYWYYFSVKNIFFINWKICAQRRFVSEVMTFSCISAINKYRVGQYLIRVQGLRTWETLKMIGPSEGQLWEGISLFTHCQLLLLLDVCICAWVSCVYAWKFFLW
jgi:hypothetical protein